MRALQIVDAKIVNADPEHPVATYWAGETLEGKAAELQVALGHAYALPEATPEVAAAEPAEASAPEQPSAVAAPTTAKKRGS